MNKHATVQDLASETRDLLSHCGVAEAIFTAKEGITARSPINGQTDRAASPRPAPRMSLPRSAAPMRPSSNGAMCRRRSAASWCACSARSCARARPSSAGWSRSRPARSPSEGLGEVQEMIDICDFAVGLSRQIYGLTIATERPSHRMMETWHPVGVVGVISAFNFPVAVWSWNAALAFVCGDTVVWKPSEKTPVTALAVQGLFERAREALPRGRLRRARPSVGGGDRRPRGRRGAGRRPARAGAFGDRLDRDGPHRRPAAGQALRPRDPRARRQQWRDRRALGRPRPRAARHRLFGDGHGRPALHVAAPPVRA